MIFGDLVQKMHLCPADMEMKYCVLYTTDDADNQFRVVDYAPDPFADLGQRFTKLILSFPDQICRPYLSELPWCIHYCQHQDLQVGQMIHLTAGKAVAGVCDILSGQRNVLACGRFVMTCILSTSQKNISAQKHALRTDMMIHVMPNLLFQSDLNTTSLNNEFQVCIIVQYSHSRLWSMHP